jgi:hypothetical protein
LSMETTWENVKPERKNSQPPEVKSKIRMEWDAGAKR